ncbi:MAG: hypothetical protein AAF629_37510 [Chloroflexota bacterium]
MELKKFESEQYGPLSIKLCQNDELHDRAFRLRYNAYISQDAIQPNQDHRFTDYYDPMINTATFLLEHPEYPIGSIRACVYGDEFPTQKLPAFEVYLQDIERELGLNKNLVESCRFVVNPELKRSYGPQVYLFRMILLNALTYQADFIITAVRKKHVRFYKRMFGFLPISEAKPYPGLTVEMVLISLTREDYLAAANRIPELHIEDHEIREYRQCLEKQL